MKVLHQHQIEQKIKRLAFEIMEENFGEDIVLAGINNNGMAFAKLLLAPLLEIAPAKVSIAQIRLSPASPLDQDVTISIPVNELKNKTIIIVDDVANTGRTIFYAFKPLLEIIPKKLEVAVLVNREHKSFPIKVDYQGLSLATTIQENIQVNISNTKESEVLLF
jgi:pyrimidine operon attenuation protein/uracil phosphoribosyltransferase